MSDDLKSAASRKASPLQTMKAVAWSFFGIRKSSGYEQDIGKLNPVHVVIAGVIGALLFIAALALLVNWIIASGVAT